ncbi:hypothetical protein [Rhizobium sp. AN80A]|uniref:hypothetical protein n=1 Tax=Rhizobium sp. AN80A TaxID=3040673 RepID=UPI0024B37A11|nr:hypothetical protein [Rhizobium sp. AN80A]
MSAALAIRQARLEELSRLSHSLCTMMQLGVTDARSTSQPLNECVIEGTRLAVH